MHVGTIRQLNFSNDQPNLSYHYLFSASDDGCIGIWKRLRSNKIQSAYPSSWECIRQLRRHKGSVRSFAIHPSNRCAFSMSDDKTFRVWNLLRGRQSYAMKLKYIADDAQSLSISPSGQYLLFNWSDRFSVFSLNFQNESSKNDSQNEKTHLGTMQFDQNMSSLPVVFSEDDRLGEDSFHMYVLVGVGGYLNLIKFNSSLNEPKIVSGLRLPGKRVKFIGINSWPSDFVDSDFVYSGRSKIVTVVTNDGDGSYVRGYAIDLNSSDNMETNVNFIPLFSYDLSGARVTALSVEWCFKET